MQSNKDQSFRPKSVFWRSGEIYFNLFCNWDLSTSFHSARDDSSKRNVASSYARFVRRLPL